MLFGEYVVVSAMLSHGLGLLLLVVRDGLGEDEVGHVGHKADKDEHGVGPPRCDRDVVGQRHNVLVQKSIQRLGPLELVAIIG